MPTFVVRVWVPDRPGALGAVASRIGSVRGDLIGIDILERGAGRAIDELVVDLPDADLVPLLVREVAQVDGVDVEDVRPAIDVLIDPRLDALETAARLVEKPDIPSLLAALAERSTRDLEGDWAAVVDVRAPAPVVAVGNVPPTVWLAAFIAGSRASMTTVPAGEVPPQAPVPLDPQGLRGERAKPLPGAGREPSPPSGPDDVAWADMGGADLVVVLGRKGRPFRARERRQLGALCRIADSRWAELVARSARSMHPTAL